MMISEEENICVFLAEGRNLESAKKQRKIIQYYDKVIKGREPLTIQNMETIEGVFHMAMGDTIGTFTSVELQPVNQILLGSKSGYRSQNDILDDAIKKGEKFLANEEEPDFDEDDLEIER